MIRLPQFTVVLVRPEFEDTIGLVARAMKNFALRDLRLVNPSACIGQGARMRASHAQEVLDEARSFRSLKESLEDIDVSVGTTAQRSQSDYRILRRPVTPRELAETLGGLEGTVALVFGPEGTGLGNPELGECDIVLTIPGSPAYPTLNLSHAAAIIFYELYASSSKIPREALASGEVKTRILTFVENAAEAVGIRGKDQRLVMRAFKSTLGRSGLRVREASLLAGFLRRIGNHLERIESDKYLG